MVVASSIGAAFSTSVSNRTPMRTRPVVLTSTKAVQVIMTQGLMYGLSSGLLFAPCLTFVDEWFSKRRGLANGILYVGADGFSITGRSQRLTSAASALRTSPQRASRPSSPSF